MKTYKMPEISVENFSHENILTESGVTVYSDAAQELANGMKDTATGGVNMVKWELYSE